MRPEAIFSFYNMPKTSFRLYFSYGKMKRCYSFCDLLIFCDRCSHSIYCIAADFLSLSIIGVNLSKSVLLWWMFLTQVNWWYRCSKFIKSSYFAAWIISIILCQESTCIVPHLLSVRIWMMSRKFIMLRCNLSVANEHFVSRFLQYPIILYLANQDFPSDFLNLFEIACFRNLFKNLRSLLDVMKFCFILFYFWRSFTLNM